VRGRTRRGHRAVTTPPPAAGGGAPALLFVANFAANTGYAWDSIEAMFAGVAARLAASHGVRSLVAYPAMTAPPRSLAGSPASAVVLAAGLDSAASVRAVAEFVRSEGVHVVYLTDRPAWSYAYRTLRRAGVRKIIVHSRTSGARMPPRGLKRLVKWALLRSATVSADTVVAVSDYVARIQVTVGMVPPRRVVRVWNGIAPGAGSAPAATRLRDVMGVAPDRVVIASASRADREKGLAELLHAFDGLSRAPGAAAPALVFMGDGPYLGELRALRDTLASRDDIHLLGYRPDARELLGDADLAVFPSWHEAFGNAVMEAMAQGRAVVATRVGGIPEVVEDGVSGVLVEPRDASGLRDAMQQLLADPARRAALGAAGRARVAAVFTRERQVEAIAALLAPSFAPE
jgi:glycosyltransferase involved in cell wall biosynthesis